MNFSASCEPIDARIDADELCSALHKIDDRVSEQAVAESMRGAFCPTCPMTSGIWYCSVCTFPRDRQRSPFLDNKLQEHESRTWIEADNRRNQIAYSKHLAFPARLEPYRRPKYRPSGRFLRRRPCFPLRRYRGSSRVSPLQWRRLIPGDAFPFVMFAPRCWDRVSWDR